MDSRSMRLALDLKSAPTSEMVDEEQRSEINDVELCGGNNGDVKSEPVLSIEGYASDEISGEDEEGGEIESNGEIEMDADEGEGNEEEDGANLDFVNPVGLCGNRINQLVENKIGSGIAHNVFDEWPQRGDLPKESHLDVFGLGSCGHA
ncbi:hypothetical protein U1Q18_032677 [Sarracenia purpurea var. burkii]